MKQYTHAWLSFMAIKRLEKAEMTPSDRVYAKKLVRWFKDHNDDVVQGAWYPDAVVKDMANSHVLKIKPSSRGKERFRSLPSTYECRKYRAMSPVKNKSFSVDEHDNLPERCESIAHSIIDHLKMQCCENKGSPVSPTNNQIALSLFMLSHYVADAHVPFHCDARKLGRLHTCMEKKWDDIINYHYDFDTENKRFLIYEDGYPRTKEFGEGIKERYRAAYLKDIDDGLPKRKFVTSWGNKNGNVREFACAICQHSYLLSYCLLPIRCGHRRKTMKYLETSDDLSFDACSTAVLSDAIDSIARVWFRVWRHFLKWKSKRKGKSPRTKKKKSAKTVKERRTKKRKRRLKRGSKGREVLKK
ncbi:MAG: hypothetical protein JSW49_00840 [candidate division WOR-3 bacterium]|nr:MAG: hypothetical protein JSW49_00840 [candidate division WOR-3 bacterium]